MIRLPHLSSLRGRRISWVPLAVLGVLLSMVIPVPGTAQAPTVSEGVVCNTSNTGPGRDAFVLTANTGYISTPDGNSEFMWGYGLGNGAFQYTGPILCANEGDTVTITLKNNLPVPTSLNLVGSTGVKANGAFASYDATTNSLTTPAAAAPATGGPGGTVTYTFVADHPGTFLYESGTNPQLQVQMGLVGTLIVRPTKITVAQCVAQNAQFPQYAPGGVAFAYDDCSTAYSPQHEFMHLLSEIDPHLHHAVELATCQQLLQANGSGGSLSMSGSTMTWTAPAGSTEAPLTCTQATVTDPNLLDVYGFKDYRARYWFINGRSFPDTLTPNFSTSQPTQPYGALVHISPTCPAPAMFQGASTIQCPNSTPWLDAAHTQANPDYNPLPGLVRFLNGGPVAYPFHPHGDHDSELGLDGRVLINPTGGTGGTPVNTSFDRFDIVVPPGQTIDTTFGWVDAQQWDPNAPPLTCAGCPNGIGVDQPQTQNLINGPYWSGSPFLGQRLPLLNGTTQWNQCGEYYHFAHSHALFQVTNYGAPGGGMLTFIRVDPPASLQKRYGTSCDGGFGYK